MPLDTSGWSSQAKAQAAAITKALSSAGYGGSSASAPVEKPAAGGSASTYVAPATTYAIKSGDTLGQIAKSNNTTVAALMALNPSLTDPNKINAGASLTIGKAAAPAASTTAAPAAAAMSVTETTPNILGNIPGETQTDRDIYSKEQELQRIRDELAAPETDEAARARLTSLFQKEIDALNVIYAQQKQDAMNAGAANLGSNRASQARFGLLGSSFGQAEVSNINQQTLDQQKRIDEQNAATIAPIYSKINEEVLAAQKAKKVAQATSVEAYIANLRETQTRKATIASTAVRNLILSKANPTEKDFQDMARQIGVDPATFKAEYSAAKKAEDDAVIKQTAAASKASLDNSLTQSQINKNNADSGTAGLLTVAEAKALGVPYGTTKAEAAKMGKTPTDGSNQFTIPSQSRNNLLKTMTPADVSALENDIRTYGYEKAVLGMPEGPDKQRIQTELNKDWGIYTQN